MRRYALLGDFILPLFQVVTLGNPLFDAVRKNCHIYFILVPDKFYRQGLPNQAVQLIRATAGLLKIVN